MTMSNDEGRIKAGGQLEQLLRLPRAVRQSLKEMCVGCGRIMHADAERREAIWRTGAVIA